MDAAIQEKCEAVVRSAGHRDDVGGIVARSVLRSATNGSAGSNDQFRHLACIQRQFHDAHVIHDVFRVSTSAASAWTSTVSATWPTCSRMLITGLASTCSTIPVCANVRKPVRLASNL